MPVVAFLLLAALLQTVSTPTPSPDFFFVNDVIAKEGLSAATAQWTARCVEGGQFAEVARTYAPDPRMTLAERQAQAARFDNAAFVRIATEAWRTANASLPQGPLRICVDLAGRTDTFTRDLMAGVSGVTAGDGRIIFRIHPGADWQAALSYAVAHEMHHSYWVGRHFEPSKPFTLADYLMLEGRADFFANSLFPRQPAWTVPLTGAEFTSTWRLLSTQLNASEWGTLQAAMFGSPQAGFPMWAGYRIGYRLVADRMARTPALDVRAMTAAAASEFFPATGN